MILRGFSVLLFCLCAIAATGCDKPSHDECKVACNRILMLSQQRFESKVKDLPDGMKARGWSDAKLVIDPLVDNCTIACVEAKDRELVNCLNAAKTPEEFIRCTEAQ